MSSLNPVPASDSAWTNAPFEAQYLKLYDVTPAGRPGRSLHAQTLRHRRQRHLQLAGPG